MEDPPRIEGVISAKEISSKDAAEFAKKFLMEFGNFLQEDIGDDIEELSTDPALTRQEEEMGPQSQVHDCLVDFVEYHLGVGNAGVKRYYDLNPQKATTAATEGSAVKAEVGDDDVAIDTRENIVSPKEIRKVEKAKEKELKRQEKERKKESKRQEKEKKKELKKERKEKRRRSKGGDGEGGAPAKKVKSES